MARISVEAEVCSKCGETKPHSEFYDSEVRATKRCKPCFRARVDATNKRYGRKSTSVSRLEAIWLDTLFRALPSSDLRNLARRPEYRKLAHKIATMVKDPPDET